MHNNCKDVFETYDLPFETYFSKCIEHKETAHDQMELIWLIKGRVTIICEKKPYHMEDQSVFMVYMNRVHEIISSEDAILISYRFKTKHLKINNLNFEQIPFGERVYSFKELCEKYHQVPLLITQILRLLISPNQSEITRYKIIGYYNLFLCELYNFLLKEKYLDVKNRNYDPFLIRIHALIEYISEHANEKITLETLASIANISTFRLSHFFKESLGISLSEFLQNTRLDLATHMLKDTKLSILEVAKSSGFSDVKYLNKMLKDKFEMTALKYRKFLMNQKTSPCLLDAMSDYIQELNICLTQIEKDHHFTDTYGLLQNLIKG